jgi:hypothetical protein
MTEDTMNFKPSDDLFEIDFPPYKWLRLETIDEEVVILIQIYGNRDEKEAV